MRILDIHWTGPSGTLGLLTIPVSLRGSGRRQIHVMALLATVNVNDFGGDVKEIIRCYCRSSSAARPSSI